MKKEKRIGVTCRRLVWLAMAFLLLGNSLTLPVQAGQEGGIVIEQTQVGNLFYDKEPKVFLIHTAAEAVEWSYVNYWNEVVESGSAPVSGGIARIEVDPNQRGWFRLTVEGRTAGVAVGNAVTEFAVFSQFDVGAVADSPFMVQTHAARSDTLAQDAGALLPIAKRLGVKYVRDCMLWREIESEQGIYAFSDYHDAFAQGLRENGLYLYATFARNNPLYDGDLAPTSEEGRLAFANYCGAVLKQYPDVVKFAEIWNEPELLSMTPGIEDLDGRMNFYVELLKTVYPVLKADAATNQVPVVGGVLTDLQEGVDLAAKMYAEGCGDYMDRLSFHNYFATIPPFLDRVSTYRRLMEEVGQGAPMDMTEYGYTTYTGNPSMTEENQAEKLAVKMVYALAAGVERVSFYNLQDKWNDPSEKESNFGLVRHPDSPIGAYTPKPAFSVYAALTRNLTGARFEEEEAWDSALSCYRFRQSDGQAVRALWSNVGSTMLLVRSDDGAISVVDMMGNERTYPVSKGIAAVSLSDGVNYVRGSVTGIQGTAYEFEAMDLKVTDGSSVTVLTDGAMSGGAGVNFVPSAASPADSAMRFTVQIPKPGLYSVTMKVKKYSTRGRFRLYVDGQPMGEEQDLYCEAGTPYEILTLGAHPFVSSGDVELELRCTGKNEASTGYSMILDYMKLDFQEEIAGERILEGLIQSAENKERARYTYRSWKGLAAALAGAKEICGKENALEAELLEAAQVLQDALGLLEMHPEPPKPQFYEVEDCSYRAEGGTASELTAAAYRNGKGVILRPASGQEIGAALIITVDAPQSGTYEIFASANQYNSRGIYQTYVDDIQVGQPTDHYSAQTVFTQPFSLGTVTLDSGGEETAAFGAKGTHTLKFVCTGKNEKSSGYTLILDYLRLDYLPEAIDKEALKRQIEEARKLDSERYTKESWEVMELVLADARFVADSSQASGQDVSDVLADLRQAVDELEEKTTDVEQPGTPEQPGGNEQPGTSEQPGGTEQPGTPEQPGGTEQPGTPEQPGGNEQPGTTEWPGGTKRPQQGSPSTGREHGKGPATGDKSNMTQLVILMTVTGMGMMGFLIRNRKKSDGSQDRR